MFKLNPVPYETETSISIAGMNYEPLYDEKEVVVIKPYYYEVFSYADFKDVKNIEEDIKRKNKIGRYRTK